jgi:hypothetical protein
MPLIDKQAAADGDEAAMEDASMAAEVDKAEVADGRMITEAEDGVIISMVGVNITDPNRSSRVG